MKQIKIIFFSLIPTILLAQYSSEIECNIKGGVYDELVEISLSSDGINQIRYTIDGSEPKASSFIYTEPILTDVSMLSPSLISQEQISPDDKFQPPNPEEIPKCIVLRAATFDNNGERTSEILTNSYIIKALELHHEDWPIVSLCADPADLLDYDSGIFVRGIHWDKNNPDWTGNYHQRGKSWEKEINFEYFESNGKSEINQISGLRTHGGNVRREPQKGLRLYARDSYGKSKFKHNFFPNSEVDKFKRLVLKPFVASWGGAGFEDYLSNTLASELDVDFIQSVPVILYLNGEYWGIYYLQERIDEKYVETHYDIDDDDVLLISNWWGQADDELSPIFNSFFNELSSLDMASEESFLWLTERVEVDNLIDYLILEIFIANRDWPGNNMKCWLPKDGDGKWKWIFFDGDAGFYKSDYDAFEDLLDEGNGIHDNVGRSSLLFRQVIQNETFKSMFFKRATELLSVNFRSSRIENIAEEIEELLSTEITNQHKRFGIPSDMGEWRNSVEMTKDFNEKRKCILTDDIYDYFTEVISLEECDIGEENRSTKMKIYPNPVITKDEITLSISSNADQEVTLYLYGINGGLITHEKLALENGQNFIKIDSKQLYSGLHFINVTNSNISLSQKLLVLNKSN